MALVDDRWRTRSISASLRAFAMLAAFALVGGAVGASASTDSVGTTTFDTTGSPAAIEAPNRPGDLASSVGFRRAEPQDEQRFLELINELRSGLGLEPLAVHPTLVPLARDWAAHLRAQGALSHANDLSVGVGEDWTRLGENVGVGPAGQVQELFDAFVASPTHYDNLVKPDYRYIGIGVVYSEDGTRIWTAHRFMAISTDTPTPPPSTPSTTATTTPPPSTSQSTTATQPTTTRPPATTSTQNSTQTPPTTDDISLDESSRAAVSPALVERLAAELATAGL